MGRENYDYEWDDHECPDAEFIEDNLPEWLNTSNTPSMRKSLGPSHPAYLRDPRLENYSGNLEDAGEESCGDALMEALFKMMYGLFLGALIIIGGTVLLFVISLVFG